MMEVNGRALEEYFPRETCRELVMAPIKVTQREGAYDVMAKGMKHVLERAVSRDFAVGTRKTGTLCRRPRASTVVVRVIQPVLSSKRGGLVDLARYRRGLQCGSCY